MHRCLLILLTWTLLPVFTLDAEEASATEPDPNLTPQLGSAFTDHAVLQQGMQVPVWGITLPQAQVTVEFDDQTQTTVADALGKWRLELDAMQAVKLKSLNEAPEGKTMTVTCEKGGKKAVTEIRDLVVGDVWICAGQSNMAGSLKRAGHPKNFPPNTVNDANYPSLRHFNTAKDQWEVCSPETVVSVSRVGFFFIREVQSKAMVPMGVIVTAVGGSKIESWLNQPPYPEGGNYTKLLKPHVGYGIRGAVWYQGESNQDDGLAYQPKLESLITGWRKAWGQGDFPIHYVQLPGLKESSADLPEGGDGRAAIRQAYVDTLKLPKTGLAVTIDIGTKGEHPPNKYDTGIRLARSVLKHVYRVKDVTGSPLYEDHKIEGDRIRVSFSDDAEVGLMVAKKATTLPEGFQPPSPTPGEKIDWLSIQSKDGSWHWADGKIDGADLVVSATGVKEPVAVRYAYTSQPLGHLLYNKDGMPVGPFSTCGHKSAQDDE